MAELHIITNEAGDSHVGYDDDGTFIPIAHVGAARIAQLKERAANLAELAKSDDANAQARHDEAAAGLPYTTKRKSKSKSTSDTEGGGS